MKKTRKKVVRKSRAGSAAQRCDEGAAHGLGRLDRIEIVVGDFLPRNVTSALLEEVADQRFLGGVDAVSCGQVVEAVAKHDNFVSGEPVG